MEVKRNGVLIQEKLLKNNKCANCGNEFFMQVYHYDGHLTKVIHCKNCNTYSHLKKKKNYNTGIKPIKKPKFLE